MKQFLIEGVNAGITNGGMACGPVPGNVIVEVTLCSEDGKLSYYSIVEAAGTLNFYESETSLYQNLIADDFEDMAFADFLEHCCTADYDDYYDFYEEADAVLPTSKTLLIRKYLAYVAWADWDEVERFKAVTIGKKIGDFEIPLTDCEEEYLEEALSENNEGEY